jgi:hypothetical protein
MRRNRKKQKSGKTSKALMAEIRSNDTVDSRLMQPGTDTLLWSVLSGSPPRFGHNNKFDNKVHNVVQMSSRGSVLASDPVVPRFLGLQFNATTDLTNFGDFNAIFDQYRIMELETWIYPQNTGVTAVNVSNYYTVIDYDDANTPGSTIELLQFTNVTKNAVTQGVYRKWRPHIASAVYSGAFTSFANEKSTWIDVASGSVQHYGIKLALDPSAGTVNLIVDVRIWVQFRNVR